MDRPYPEFFKNDPTKAILRDFPDYYANAQDGCIYRIKSGKALKHGKHGGLSLWINGKPTPTSTQIQLLTAFRLWPGEGYTVDHIDPTRPDDHRLENLRWANKSEQRANQNRPSRYVGMERPITVTYADGSKTKYSTATAWMESLNDPAAYMNKIKRAIKSGKPVYGAVKVEWWVPSNTGVFLPIPSDKINGTTGYSISQFGGWVQLPTGKYSSGHKRDDGRFVININRTIYLVYRLVGFTHLTPPTDPRKKVINHKDGNPSNNDYTNLEWVTQQENALHAHNTGLCLRRKPVCMFSLSGKKIWTFCSITEAVLFVKRLHKVASGSSIVSCCNGKRRKVYGYKWEFVN